MTDWRLDPTVTRRGLFRLLVREAHAMGGLMQGKKRFKLASLASLPDEQVARLIPTVNPIYAIEIADGHVWAKSKDSGQTVRLFGLEPENTVAFNLFNGQNTLGEAGRLLAEQLGWDEERAFVHVRELFLNLALHLVCLPSNPLEVA